MPHLCGVCKGGIGSRFAAVGFSVTGAVPAINLRNKVGENRRDTGCKTKSRRRSGSFGFCAWIVGGRIPGADSGTRASIQRRWRRAGRQWHGLGERAIRLPERDAATSRHPRRCDPPRSRRKGAPHPGRYESVAISRQTNGLLLLHRFAPVDRSSLNSRSVYRRVFERLSHTIHAT